MWKWMDKARKPNRKLSEKALIYISPEGLKHVHIIPLDDFEEFQNHAEFVDGGRLLEVNRQIGYTLKQVADLQEEEIQFMKNSAGKPAVRQQKSAPPPPSSFSAANDEAAEMERLMAQLG